MSDLSILYFNVIEQNAGWGAEWFIDRALRAAGHRTHCIDYRRHRGELRAKLAEAPHYDAVLIQRGDRFPLDLVDATHGPRVFWASELIARCRDQDHLIASGRFDHVFFHTGACLRTAVSRGWLPPERASVLLNGFDPQRHHPVPGTARDIDILFAGTLTPRRRRILKDLGRRLPVTVGSAFGPALTHLVSRSRIVLNLHAEDCPDTDTRVFETLGSRGFLVSEALSEESPFTAGEHYVSVADPAQLADALDRYRHDAGAREAVAAEGFRAAVAGHTYAHRAAEIAAVLSRCLAGAAVTPAPPEALGIYRDGAGGPAASLQAFYAAVSRALKPPAGCPSTSGRRA